MFLLVFGVLVIAGIYIWGTMKDRKTQRQQTIHEPLQRHDIPEVKVETQASAEIDYATALQGLTRSLAENREIETTPAGITARDLSNDPTDQTAALDEPLFKALEPEPEMSLTEEDNTKDEELVAPEKIVMLHIIPRGKNQIEGMAILHSMKELDMSHGKMEIFHHYGVGQMKMDQPLFSLANMVEPGNFILAEMENFSTPGLVMFLGLPSAIDAQVVFELMLNTAQRLADLLEADVCDETRKLIDEKKLDVIRGSLV